MALSIRLWIIMVRRFRSVITVSLGGDPHLDGVVAGAEDRLEQGYLFVDRVLQFYLHHTGGGSVHFRLDEVDQIIYHVVHNVNRLFQLPDKTDRIVQIIWICNLTCCSSCFSESLKTPSVLSKCSVRSLTLISRARF